MGFLLRKMKLSVFASLWLFASWVCLLSAVRCLGLCAFLMVTGLTDFRGGLALLLLGMSSEFHAFVDSACDIAIDLQWRRLEDNAEAGL